MWRAFVNAIMNLRVPKNAGNFLNSLEPVSFSRRTLLNGVRNQVMSNLVVSIVTREVYRFNILPGFL
jgi:hypothetical protein